MRYSIITPTIVRSTLPILCDSIDRQTNDDWEHLIAVDVDISGQPDKQKLLDGLRPSFDRLGLPRRKIIRCLVPHEDTGNTCRRNLSMLAQGDYILYIDDDNYYADARVLESLESVATPFVSFGLLYRGQSQRPDPVESSNVMVQRGLHVFPESSERNADQAFVQELLQRGLEHTVIYDRPLVVVPYENTGVDH